MQNIIQLIPKDELYNKRVSSLKKAITIYQHYEDGKIVGLVFVRKKFGLNEITWITHGDYRNRGIATKLVKEAQKNFDYLVAKTRNKASKRIAQKTGFFNVFGNYWMWNKNNILFITRP